MVRVELLSSEQVSDKTSGDVLASGSSSSSSIQDADRREVCSMIKQTGAVGNNERQAAAAAAAEREQADDTELTSGPSQAAAASGRGEGRFTVAAPPPRGVSAADRPDPTGSRGETAGRRAIDDDDEDHLLGDARRETDDAGLMCRYDVITRRPVTDDVSGSCGVVTTTMAKANRARKSPDPFYDDDHYEVTETDDSVRDDEALSLQRQNCVLTELLSAKKLELEETRQRFKVCTGRLEDEVERLHHEKERLLDRLQLPEDERCSLAVEQQSLDELRRRLRQCEEHREQLKTENIELKQDLRDAELTMQELHDQFQAEEGVELRELQRELDNTARDCRLLHFKVTITPLI